MDNSYDVIIIGSGIGGLTAGNYLAQAGYSTLIIEQNPRPGGCATSFARGGFRFDAGVHWIAQCGEGGIIHQILRDLGLEGEIDFVQIDPPLAVATPGNRYAIPQGRSQTLAYLQGRFPAEREGLDRFFALQGKITQEMFHLFTADPDAKEGLARLGFHATFPLRFPHIARYHRRRGAEVVDRLTRDPDLRRILKIAAIFPRVSMVMLSWFWNIISSADCYYPRGGIQRIADVLAENCRRGKGEILYDRRVAEILTQKGRATGVRLADNTVIGARTVISNADARQTFLQMLGGDSPAGDPSSRGGARLPRRYLESLRKWRLSESFFYVYLGVDLDLKAGDSCPFPVLWYFPEREGRAVLPEYIGIGIPSLSDEGAAPAGGHAVVIGAFAPDCERWFGRVEGEHRRGYEDWKEGVADSLVRLAGEAIPGLESHILVKEAASPLTFYRYTGNSMGASSGWSMDAEEQHKLPQKTPIKNLFLAGHWTFNPGGLPAAFMTGRRAAEWVEGAL
ncbi:MAG: NAD(P)/FAD-dependent oxidoreductase [bacterium]